jgi:hypothetical protein
LYESYFKLCGAAYTDYSAGQYVGASEKYKAAFKSVGFSLGSDLHNALRVAQHIQDTAWAYDIAVQLAKGGMPVAYFDKLEASSWIIRFKQDFPAYSTFYKSHFDLTAREKFLDICELDSAFNESYHAFRTGKLDMTLAELISGATEVLDSLKSLIHAHGFPCEQIIGYNDQDSIGWAQKMTVLFAHIYQRGELFYLDRLSTISCDGKLRPVDAFDISRFRGFGDSTGIEQEMTIRYQKYSRKEKYDP